MNRRGSRSLRLVLLAGFAATAPLRGNPGTPTTDSQELDALRAAEEAYLRVESRLPADAHASETDPQDGTWQTVDRRKWDSGFHSGVLWHLSAWTADPAWRSLAEARTADLESQQFDTSTHDIGFQLLPSFGLGFEQTHRADYKLVLRTAADSLATRFDPVVGCFRSWDWGSWKFPVIVDNLMNLELLFFAAEHGGDPAYADMARRHAERTLLDHVRADGSSYHGADYSPTDGSLRSHFSYQGLSTDSTWARGQAWCIHGFTMVYRHTGDPRFLDAALHMADWWIDHVPADRIPLWDFDAAPGAATPRDTSAAAVAASGFRELASHAAPGPAARLREEAQRTLDSLLSPIYRGDGLPTEALLLHGTRDLPHGKGIDVGLSFGDYYLLEALARGR